jgi:hypothetical protein
VRPPAGRVASTTIGCDVPTVLRWSPRPAWVVVFETPLVGAFALTRSSWAPKAVTTAVATPTLVPVGVATSFEDPGGDFRRAVNQGPRLTAATDSASQAGSVSLPGVLQMGAPRTPPNLTFPAGDCFPSPNKVRNRASGGLRCTPGRESFVALDANARALFADGRDGNLS